MVDNEVESILLEIRERVRAGQRELALVSRRTNDGDHSDVTVASNGERAPGTAEALARIEAYLTTTERAWDRLPPLVSNRSGTLARLELWVKRHFKKATRWYAWEQINFNAAVHHALRDMLLALSTLEQQSQKLREEMREAEAKFEGAHREIDSQRARSETQDRDINLQLEHVTAELRQRDERLLDEQRVCLKQLSLEMTEARTLLDRARREIESRLEKLETAKRKS
ncbi:MAG: hypothetical protein ACREBG_08635 [Pyrinomonadaceae bacterium]